MPYRAFLDANVLVPARLRDVLLSVAEAGLFRVHWSASVLAEVERHLPASMDDGQRGALMQALAEAFPDAMTDIGPVHIDASALHINDKDEHIVLHALACAADVLVTDDRRLRDEVTQGALGSLLDAQSPDVFLAYALDVDIDQARRALTGMVRERWGMASLTDTEIGDRLSAWMDRSGLTASADQVRRTW